MTTLKRIIRKRVLESPRLPMGEQIIRVEFGRLSIGEIATLRRTAGVKESTLDPRNRGAVLTEKRFAELRAGGNLDRQALFWKAKRVRQN